MNKDTNHKVATKPRLEYSSYFIIDKFNVRETDVVKIRTPYGYLNDQTVGYLKKVGLQISLLAQDEKGSDYQVSKSR